MILQWRKWHHLWYTSVTSKLRSWVDDCFLRGLFVAIIGEIHSNKLFFGCNTLIFFFWLFLLYTAITPVFSPPRQPPSSRSASSFAAVPPHKHLSMDEIQWWSSSLHVELLLHPYLDQLQPCLTLPFAATLLSRWQVLHLHLVTMATTNLQFNIVH